MTRVQTGLWCDGQIDEVADVYVSLVPGSRIISRTAYVSGASPPGGPDMTGQALAVDLELAEVPPSLRSAPPPPARICDREHTSVRDDRHRRQARNGLRSSPATGSATSIRLVTG